MKMKWSMRWSLMALAILLVSSVWAQPPGRPGGMRDSAKRDVSRFVAGVGRLEEKGKAKLSTAQAKKVLDLVSPWRRKSTMTDAQAKDLAKKLNAVLTSAQTKELQSLRPRRGEGRGGPGGDRRGGGDGPRGGRDGDRRGGGPGGPGGDRRGGGPGGPGGRDGDWRKGMEKAEAFFKTHNPLAAPSLNPSYKQLPSQMQEGVKRRYDANNAVFTQLGKKAGRR